MSNPTYKKIEIVGTSSESVEEAIQNAVAQASKSVKNINWFEIPELRGAIADGKVSQYQVTVKMGFRVEEGQ